MQRLEALIDGKLAERAMHCCWGKNLQIKKLSHAVQNRGEEKRIYAHSTAR